MACLALVACLQHLLQLPPAALATAHCRPERPYVCALARRNGQASRTRRPDRCGHASLAGTMLPHQGTSLTVTVWRHLCSSFPVRQARVRLGPAGIFPAVQTAAAGVTTQGALLVLLERTLARCHKACTGALLTCSSSSSSSSVDRGHALAVLCATCTRNSRVVLQHVAP